MTEIRYPILPISDADMDELIRRESKKSPFLRLVGYPAYRSSDGRLYPLPHDGLVAEDDFSSAIDR